MRFMRTLFLLAVCLLSGTTDLFARTETNSTALKDGFVKTNGEYVTIGTIMVKTNSPQNTDEFKRFRWRDEQLMEIANSSAPDAMDKLAEGAWALIKDYPNEANGYQDIMIAADEDQYDGKPDKARTLANELIESSAPKEYKLWANGFLNRLDSFGKPISLQFKAVDGRGVDLAKMRGKVVLVDFWATTCGPCVKELPRVKAAYDKFHGQGFEVIGISCDTDKEQLNKFLDEKGLPWPQYFDGKQQTDNKFAQGFGIDGIPQMFLVDKKGFLRFDNVRASDNILAKGDTTSFEDKISTLLTE
jgi:peroxiredoxin